MKEIRLTLNDEQAEELKLRAKALNLSVTAYINWFIREKKLTVPEILDVIDYQDTRQMIIRMPAVLVESVDAEANKLGISRNGYLTLLLLKEPPIHVTYSENPITEFSNELRDTMNDIKMLTQTVAMADGNINQTQIEQYESELEKLYEEMLKALKVVKKNGRKNYKQFCDELYHRGDIRD